MRIKCESVHKTLKYTVISQYCLLLVYCLHSNTSIIFLYLILLFFIVYKLKSRFFNVAEMTFHNFDPLSLPLHLLLLPLHSNHSIPFWFGLVCFVPFSLTIECACSVSISWWAVFPPEFPTSFLPILYIPHIHIN